MCKDHLPRAEDSLQSKEVRKKLYEDRNKQVRLQEGVHLLDIPVYEKIWNAYEVVADLADT